MASESECPRTFLTPSSRCACLLVQSECPVAPGWHPGTPGVHVGSPRPVSPLQTFSRANASSFTGSSQGTSGGRSDAMSQPSTGQSPGAGGGGWKVMGKMEKGCTLRVDTGCGAPCQPCSLCWGPGCIASHTTPPNSPPPTP